jgi:folate-binding protein YgfZ
VTSASTVARDAGALGEIAGRPIVLHYGDVAVEYAALRKGAMLIDRSHRTRTTLEGPKAAEVLTGLVTNDVQALAPGHGQYAAALSPKGKIIADVRIFAREGHLLIDVPPRAAAGWMAMLRKFVNPRVAAYVDRSHEMRDVGVFGVSARRVVATLTALDAEALEALPPYGHLVAMIDGAAAMVVRSPDLGYEGYEILVAPEVEPLLWQRAANAGATPSGLDAWEIARVEAGRPEWGLDIDESTIPQEANFDELHAISYTKGCYTGQETVARVHFRGHVNRHLRGLQGAESEGMAPRAQLFDDAGKLVGELRTSLRSPRLGPIALGMVRREVAPATTLRATCESGETTVIVVPLPFPT